MKTRLIMNLVLLAVIAALGAVALLKPGKQEPAAPPLLTVDANALTRLTLQNKETLVFEKQNGVWRLTAPFAAPVNQIRVGQLLEIPQARSEAHYPVQPEALAQFGLDKPPATLTFGQTALQFGGTDPINMRRYVRLGDTLHLVDDNFFHHLTAAATDYVDKKLLPEGAKIQSIELPGLKAAKSAEGKWTREAAAAPQPAPSAADQTQPEAKPAKPEEKQPDLGELASAWVMARAIDVKRLQAEPLGETIRIGLAEGTPVEFVILKKEPELILARKDLGLQYEVTSDTARDLLHQPSPPPARPGGKPGAPGAEADDDDRDDGHEDSGEPGGGHEDSEESGGEDSGHDQDDDDDH